MRRTMIEIMGQRLQQFALSLNVSTPLTGGRD